MNLIFRETDCRFGSTAALAPRVVVGFPMDDRPVLQTPIQRDRNCVLRRQRRCLEHGDIDREAAVGRGLEVPDNLQRRRRLERPDGWVFQRSAH